jgi:hypothetical protein
LGLFRLEEHDLFALAATYAQGVPVSIGPPGGIAKPMKRKKIILCAQGLTDHPDDTARKGWPVPSKQIAGKLSAATEQSVAHLHPLSGNLQRGEN